MVTKTGLNVGVLGFGVVGSVTAEKLYQLGNEIYVNDIRPVAELKGWKDYFHFKKNYTLRQTDATFLILPTPSTEEQLYRGLTPEERAHTIEGRFDETLDTRSYKPVIESLGKALSKHSDYHLFVVRSTVEPGTTRKFGKILEQISGKKMGRDFGMGMIPEFLRAYNNANDEETAKMVVLGNLDKRSLNLMSKIYQYDRNKNGESRLFSMTLEEAELVKLENNAINAVWISLQNSREEFYEMLGEKGISIDYDRMTKVLTTMTEAYTNPLYGTSAGLWFGGTCLKKDPQALHSWAEDEIGIFSHFTRVIELALHINGHIQRKILGKRRLPETLKYGLPERLKARDDPTYENVRKFLHVYEEITDSTKTAQGLNKKVKN